jgi:antiviral helicase SLH1
MGAEDEVDISLSDLSMPSFTDCHTPLLDLAFLPVLGNQMAASFKLPFQHFNGIQTQSIWASVHTSQNVLLCAPSGTGKSTLLMLALWQVLEL